MKTNHQNRWLSFLLTLTLMLAQLAAPAAMADQVKDPVYRLVLTLGADLNDEQRNYVLNYFGVRQDDVYVITITNADEREHLGELIPLEEIGTRTLSCALVKPTTSGGIQVKTANMYYVTSNMIASTLSTSGVYNCEVLTAAPFEVSGTGALTGAMMAYETAMGEPLDPEMKGLANEELVLTGEIAQTVGQEQATLVVNDIKIHIVRDGITGEQQVREVVDEVVAVTEEAAAAAAAAKGEAAPAKLGEVQHEQLYSFGVKFSQMGYRYKDMAPTLERVTYNITRETGIEDPITDTFTTIEENEGLSVNSILLGTDDSVLGEDAIINATDTVAVGDHPAEEIPVITGDVQLTDAGKVKAESFINHTNLIAFRDLNGSYALIDLNGNVLTEAAYTRDFRGANGMVEAILDDGSGLAGILGSDGTVEVPFQYDYVRVMGKLWAFGAQAEDVPSDSDEKDFYRDGWKRITQADIYYLGGEESTLVGTLPRDRFTDYYAFGDYLNVRDAEDNVSTYDIHFDVVQNPSSLYDSRYDESYALAEALSAATGYTVDRFYGGYAEIHDYSGSGKTGIVDRYGNIIIPMEFDNFYTWYDNADDFYTAGGYFAAGKDDHLIYVTQGGNATGSFEYSPYDVYNYGMSARVKLEDGSQVLLAADGVETSLGTTYEYLYAITESKGLLWKGEKSDYSYDLLDWHGNVLASGADDYSVSANGNYIIAQDGYTSSTLYLVNDASPVSITEGGAAAGSEIQAASRTGASLEPYTGNPVLKSLGTTGGSRFIDGTHLLLAEGNDWKYALTDLEGHPLTEAVYESDISYEYGWLQVSVEEDDAVKYGVLSLDGREVLPCGFDRIEILNEHWIAAFTLNENGTEEDYDYKNYSTGAFLQIETALICHLSETEIATVTLTRDQVADIRADGEYLNIQNRETGLVTTYDSSFTAVAAVDYIYRFDEFSVTEVTARMLRDKTGYYIDYSQFPDGYSSASHYVDGESFAGIMNMDGEMVVPAEYSRFVSYYNLTESGNNHLWARGYFCARQGDNVGYVTKDGVSCEISIPYDGFYNQGMAGTRKMEDGTYQIIAADGTVTSCKNYPSMYAGGLFWRVSSESGKGYDLLDWHGNAVLEGYYSIDVSTDGQFVVAQAQWGTDYELFSVDGAGGELVPAGGIPSVIEQTEAAEEVTEAAETEAAEEVTEAAETEAAEEVTTAAVSGSGAAAGALITSAKSLLGADVSANIVAVRTLLEQAKGLLETENPSVSALLGSALMLLSVENIDTASVNTLLDTAITLLQ